MQLSTILTPERTQCAAPGSSKKRVLENIPRFICQDISALNPNTLFDNLIERERLGLEPMRIDVNLLEALEHGIGNVAGVAIGVERLLGALLGHPDIAAVSAFGHAHAVPANQ